MHKKKKSRHVRLTTVVQPHKTGWENKGQTKLIMRKQWGVVNVSLKNVGLGKFWPDLDILEAFEMGIEVLFLGDFVSRSLHYF